MLQKASVASCLVLLAAPVVAVGLVQSADPSHLYECADGSDTVVTIAAATLCDARATSNLTRRAESDNLQVREGALVLEVEAGGISATAGLQPDDVIYRVGGVDVSSASAAATELNRIGATADTVVNFLRGGRPYRVKLRRS